MNPVEVRVLPVPRMCTDFLTKMCDRADRIGKQIGTRGYSRTKDHDESDERLLLSTVHAPTFCDIRDAADCSVCCSSLSSLYCNSLNESIEYSIIKQIGETNAPIMPFGRRSRQRALTSRQWIWCSVLLTLSMCHPLSAFLQPVHLWPAVVVLPRRSTPWEISRQFIHTERSVTMQDDEWMRANLDTTAEPWLKNQVLKRRGRKVLAGIISIVSFLIMCTIYRSAVTSLILQPFRQSALIVNYKVIKRFVLVLWLLMASTHTFRVSRRQAVDATSEWGRYARNPGARGRALTWLLMRVLIVFFISKIAFKERLLRYSGSMFSNGLLKIGPLYIKLGQIISCREDVLPEPWIKSMEKLQDQVPAKSGNNALELAYTAWETVCKDKNAKEDFHATFEEFDTTPIAAASLGQVHRAKLRSSGREVAIKLQRQYLRQIYDQDLALLEKVAEAVDNFRGRFKNVGGVSQSWRDIFKDAETILYREIDYRSEAENGSRFCQDFGIALGGKPSRDITTRSQDGEVLPSASSWLRAPYVYKDYCAEKVLVMEYVPSVKITDTVKLEEASVTLEDREYLADMLGRSYLRQFCCHLFFVSCTMSRHTDCRSIKLSLTSLLTPSIISVNGSTPRQSWSGDT